MTNHGIKILLTDAEALVLFELLSKWFHEETEVSSNVDEAEERVFSKILGYLERELAQPFVENYEELMEKAKTEILNQGQFKY